MWSKRGYKRILISIGARPSECCVARQKREKICDISREKTECIVIVTGRSYSEIQDGGGKNQQYGCHPEWAVEEVGQEKHARQKNWDGRETKGEMHWPRRIWGALVFCVCVCVCVSDKEDDFLLRRHLAPTVDYLSTVVASSRRFYLNFRIPEQKQLKRNWRVQRV